MFAGLFFVDEDGLKLKVFVFFGCAGQEEGVGEGGFALGYGGDDVATAQPMGLGQIG